MSNSAEIGQGDVERIIAESLAKLYSLELETLRLDVAERTLCARLAAILQPLFEKHAVHTEYNRHGVEPKTIQLPNAEGVLTDNRVNPDIVVHQPGHDDQNILVIEVKKSTNVVPDDADLMKLDLIKRQIGYRYALFIRLSAGPNADGSLTRMIWV